MSEDAVRVAERAADDVDGSAEPRSAPRMPLHSESALSRAAVRSRSWRA
ncbi:hypothetical protein [Streptomyces sp. ICC1]|nr:hypothetical protein [Streptomyces sp. ICC1]